MYVRGNSVQIRLLNAHQIHAWLSYVTHHTRRIATAIIKNDAYAINAQARHLKTVLYDHRLGDGHEHSRADDAAF